jgi:hypothetical protein
MFGEKKAKNTRVGVIFSYKQIDYKLFTNCSMLIKS